MKKQQKKSAAAPTVKWFYEVHELPGRDVTIVEVVAKGRGHRGVSIRNPHDCPLPHDGIKYALTRAMQGARLPKTQRRLVWQDFLARFKK